MADTAIGQQFSSGAVTYYGRPALKPSVYGWLVAAYIFAGGLSAGIQIVATVAELLGMPSVAPVVLAGRAIVLAGAILGGILLIVDLHTPQRFYNMLRIFRATSPMSIGTYVLMTFGFFSLLALAFQLAGLRWVATACGIVAAIAGWGMASYTAALLSATSTPLWAAAPRLLGVRFASSAIASGAAALCIIAIGIAQNSGAARAFGYIAILSLAVELIASIFTHLAYRTRGVARPLEEYPWGALHLFGVQLIGRIVPIVLYLVSAFANVGTLVLPIVASLCVLAGDLLMRGSIMLAGNESAKRPQDYFRFAQIGQSQHGGGPR